VQLDGDFALENTIMPFDSQLLNVGGAMDLATGIFTVPVDGIYHFEFKGIRHALSGIGASLWLKTGDRVTLYKTVGIIHDYTAAHFSSFTGWLVEEDLMLSI